MEALQGDLELYLFPKGLEGPERDGGRRSGYAYGHGCQWVDLCRDRGRFYLRVRL